MGVSIKHTRERRDENMRRPPVIVLALLLALYGQVARPDTPLGRSPLLISQALRYALEHSPSVMSAKSSITSAQAQKLAAVAALLPSLSLTEEPQIFTPVVASGSSVIGGVVVPSGHGYNANVASANLSLNLFSGGKSVANLRANLAALRSADLGLTAALDALFEQLLTDFTAASSDQIALRSAERIVVLDSDLVRLTALRLQGRVASEIDLIQTQQQLLQARLQLSQARQQSTSDLEKVYADMGFTGTGGVLPLEEWIPAAPPTIPNDPVQEDPSVISAREALTSAQEKVTAARADYYPNISLVAQYNYLGIDPASMGLALRATHANNYSIGVEVTVPILPFYNVRAEVDSADAEVESAEGQYRVSLVSAGNRVMDTVERFREAQSALGIAIRSEQLARHNLRLMQDRRAARQASVADVDRAELSAAQAEESLATARIALRLAGWERYRSMDGKEFPTALLAAVIQEQHSASPRRP